VGWAPSCYAYNAQVFAKADEGGHLTSWDGAARIPDSIPDGTSWTILLAEKYPRCHEEGSLWAAWEADPWQPGFAIWSIGREAFFQMRPAPYLSSNCDPTRPATPHRSGIGIALVDGSVRRVGPQISPERWWAACTPAGGEVFEGEEVR
jgi:hypothetical protein